MNKYLVSAVLALLTGNAQAHSHPSVDALTHAVEHAVMNLELWQPYLQGLSLLALVIALLQIRRNRRAEDQRRPK